MCCKCQPVCQSENPDLRSILKATYSQDKSIKLNKIKTLHHCPKGGT